MAEIEKTIHAAGSTLVYAFKKKGGWPYRLKSSGTDQRPKNLSHSTTAMVTLSLLKLIGAWRRPASYGVSLWFDPPQMDAESSKATAEVAKHATELLIANLNPKKKVTTT